jgi:beta-1,4-mannooligosaccharide/beta-1,4-mannosyl-N-acetylglucosamine phosphorylase
VVWRSASNPIIPRDIIPTSNSVFNSAVVPYGDGFAGVFRCDDKRRVMQMLSGKSADGINWTLRPKRIHFVADNPRVEEIIDFQYAYDPRVCWLARY